MNPPNEVLQYGMRAVEPTSDSVKSETPLKRGLTSKVRFERQGIKAFIERKIRRTIQEERTTYHTKE